MPSQGNIKIDRVLDNVVICTVKLGRPGLIRTISPKALSVDADAEMLRAQKQLFESPELERVAKQDGRIRRWLYGNALPGNLGDGVHVLAVSQVDKADEILQRLFEQREELVEDAVNAYPVQYREAKKKLRELWDDSDFLDPEAYRSGFQAKRIYARLGSPEPLRSLGQEIYEQKNRELEGVWADFIIEVRDAFRQMFSDLVGGLVDRLETGLDGKPAKRLTQPALDKITKFLDDFKIKDVQNDRDLGKLVEQFRKLLGGTDAKTLRDDTPLRNRICEETQKILGFVEKNLEVRPKRAISLDEEE